MSYKILFNHAVVSPNAEDLGFIIQSRISLAVWKRTPSKMLQNYLAAIDLSKIGPANAEWTDGYFKDVLRTGVPMLGADSAAEDRLAHRRMFDFYLDRAGFPKSDGRNALIDETHTISDAFLKATRGFSRPASFSLLVFAPLANNIGWHVDHGSIRGNATLGGDIGMVWRPNSTIASVEPVFHQNNDFYYGPVSPEQDYIQRLDTGDLAVFRCGSNGLSHATPPPPLSRTYRLAMVMGLV